MRDLNIRTTLDVCPGGPKKEVVFITRGATAELIFNLSSKVYTLDDVEQILFTFKQNKKVYSYQMFDYVKPTQDNEIDFDKRYYKNVQVPNNDPLTSMAVGDEVLDPVAELPAGKTPRTANWYEVFDLPNGQDATDYYWIMNKHFWYNKVDTYSWITFIFSSEETKKLFKDSKVAGNILFEVAVRLDTDGDEFHTHGRDSLIIEHQPPIAVMDSLYSGSSSGGSTNDIPVCSTTRSCGY